MTQHVQQPAQHSNRAAALARTAAQARRQVRLRRRQQKRWPPPGRSAIAPGWSWSASGSGGNATRGQQVGLLAWFVVQGKIDQQVVRADWSDGRLCCDRLLIDLGAEFSSDDPHTSLQAPLVAVLVTLIRACDLTTATEVDLGDRFTQHLAIRFPTA